VCPERFNARKQPSYISSLSHNKKTPISLGETLMAYKRKTSKVIAAAHQRAANLQSISPTLDLGNGLTLANYTDKITSAQAALDAYNIQLAQADGLGNDFKAEEKEMRTLSTRMLAAVGVKYGKDSNEYEMAGGTRTSEIERKKKPENPPA
jgi:uncharacterized protein YciW